MPEISTRVCILQRIIQAVAITVETLAEIRQLYVVIGGKETAESRVVEAAVHIDEPKLWHHLMSGISMTEVQAVDSDRLLAPDIVLSGKDHIAIFTIEACDAALMTRGL